MMRPDLQRQTSNAIGRPRSGGCLLNPHVVQQQRHSPRVSTLRHKVILWSAADECSAASSREDHLLAELVAARHQVDKLLLHQQVLLSILAQSHGVPGPEAYDAAGGSRAVSSPPTVTRAPAIAPPSPTSTPKAATARDTTAGLGSAASARPAAQTFSPSNTLRNEVAELLHQQSQQQPQQQQQPPQQSSASPASSSPRGGGSYSSSASVAKQAASVQASLTAAIKAVHQGDVMQDIDFNSLAATRSPQADDEKATSSEPPTIFSLDKLPVVALGCDDLVAMSKLHAGLEAQGYYPGEEDMENWLFGESTQAAVMYLQAAHKLPETGVVNEATWRAVLGDEVPQAPSRPPPPPASTRSDTAAGVHDKKKEEAFSSWPVLMEGDGGRAVHVLHLLLSQRGYHCGNDEMRWWMLETFTVNALKSFQACFKLPESGVVDEAVWRALLGDAGGAQPSALDEVLDQAAAEGDEYAADVTVRKDGCVWLLGEERWSCNVYD